MKSKKVFVWLILSCLVLALAFTLINTHPGLTGNMIASLEKFKLMPSRAESTAVLEPAPTPTMSDGLNLTKIKKIYPESFGNNYNHSGTYNVYAGDGFIKGDILIKVIKFTVSEYPGDGKGEAILEVFKKESDGRYYHLPTSKPDTGRLVYGSFFDLFGLTLEMPGFTSEISPINNTIIYHENCTIYFDYCNDYRSGSYSPGNCQWRCPFEVFRARSEVHPDVITTLETKLSDGRFTVVFPVGYDALAEYALRSLKQCYNNVTAFLEYEPYRPRVGLKVIRWPRSVASPGSGIDEYVIMYWGGLLLDELTRELSSLEAELANIKCPQVFLLGHELTHVVTKEMIGDNFGLNEGLGEYVHYHTSEGTGFTPAHCFEDNFDGNPYANLSSIFTDYPSVPSWHYYATGFCFWQDFVNMYGEGNFTKLIQESYTRSRGVGKYYLLDVMQEVIGEPVSSEILDRYSLTRQATLINVCEGCEVYMPKYTLNKPPVSRITNLRTSLNRFFGKRV